MAQTVHANETDRTDDNGSVVTPSPIADFSAWATLAEQLVQAQVRKEIAGQLAAGHPVYYGGTGADSQKVFELRPDGKVFEVRVLEDGTIEEIRQVVE